MPNIKSKECKFVLRSLPNNDTPHTDYHYVKEKITYEDGTTSKNFKLYKDFQLPFYITKPHFQNHKDKKESEMIEKLNVYSSNYNLRHKTIASRLGSKYIGAKSMRDVVDSPYLYGTDIDSRAIIKKLYMEKYPEVNSKNDIVVLDIEVNTETDEMIIISIASEQEVYVAILESLVEGIRKVDEQLHFLYDEYIPKTDVTKNIKPVFEIFKTEIDMLKAVLSRLHKWQPEFVAIWNIDYDLPYLINVCKKYHVDPKDIFSDPSLDPELRYFQYKQGKKVKLTESGVHKPIDPQEQWHVVHAPCSWYFIDAMCAYYFIRVGTKKIPGGYSLNNILEKELGKNMKKLKFEDDKTESLTGIDWHRYMVENKPLEYIIYNAWDTMSILELDNKTKDLSNTISVLAGVSSFDIFDSGPKKIIDALHFFYIDNGRVLGVKGVRDKEMEDLGLDLWIMILNNTMIKNSSINVIKEDGIIHNIYGLTADLD